MNQQVRLKIKKEYNPIPKNVLDKIVNPAAAAFENALNDLKLQPSKEILNDIHLILIMDGSQYNNKILSRLNELIEYIDQYYDVICAIFTDISHYNPLVQSILINNNIFDKLDYTKSNTFDLVFNICDQNKDAWTVFNKHMTDDIKQNNHISALINQFK